MFVIFGLVVFDGRVIGQVLIVLVGFGLGSAMFICGNVALSTWLLFHGEAVDNWTLSAVGLWNPV